MIAKLRSFLGRDWSSIRAEQRAARNVDETRIEAIKAEMRAMMR